MFRNPKPLNLVSQFTCTSSLIFLTHPDFIKKSKSVFEIDTIYDINRMAVWNFTQEQNTYTIPMQNFQIKLKLNKPIGPIVKFCLNYNGGASILDVLGVPKNQEIADILSIPPEPFPDDVSTLVRGVEYKLPSDLLDSVPKKTNIRKHIKYQGVNISIYTRSDQTAVCELSK